MTYTFTFYSEFKFVSWTKFRCWRALLFPFHVTTVCLSVRACSRGVRRGSFACWFQDDPRMLKRIRVRLWVTISGFYRILRPRETPLVPHSEPRTCPVVGSEASKWRFRCFCPQLVAIFRRFVPISGSLRKSPKCKDFQNRFPVKKLLYPGFTMQGGEISLRLFSLQTVLRLMAADKFLLPNLWSVRGFDFLPFPPDEWTSSLSAPDFYQQIFRICISFVRGAARPMKMRPANCRFLEIGQSGLCPCGRRRGLERTKWNGDPEQWFCFAFTLLKAFNFFMCSSYRSITVTFVLLRKYKGVNHFWILKLCQLK